MRNIAFVLALLGPVFCFAQRELHVGRKPYLTIGAAARVARPGDIITVHAGVYRERIDPAVGGSSDDKRIVYRAAAGEKVVVKGSEIVKGWASLGSDIWRLSLPDVFFGAYNPYTDVIYGDWFFPGSHRLHTGEVYNNGRPLYEVDSVDQLFAGLPAEPRLGAIGIDTAALRGVWCCEHRGDSTILYARFVGGRNPNTDTVEINVRPMCFYPSKTGVNYITIRGFELSQAATQWAAPTAEQEGLIGTNWSKGWIIEDNIIHDAKCVGITLGKDRASGHNVWSKDLSQDGAVLYNAMVRTVIQEGWSKQTIGSHIVRRNTIYRCGAAGVCGSFGGAFSVISDNHIYDICTYRPFWGAEMAGIKLHAGLDVQILRNHIHNSKIGIWLDWMAQGIRVTENLFYENDFVDLYPEVDHGPYLVDNNVFLSPYSLRDQSEGGAFVHNLFGGMLGHTPQDRVTPYFKPHTTVLAGESSVAGGDDKFFHNVFLGNGGMNHIRAPHLTLAFDEMDVHTGYGLAIYDSAVRPVRASGNVYLRGAMPLGTEKDPVMEPLRDPRVRLVFAGDSVVLAGDWGGLQLDGLGSDRLMEAVVPKQGYTTPEGGVIRWDAVKWNGGRVVWRPAPAGR